MISQNEKLELLSRFLDSSLDPAEQERVEQMLLEDDEAAEYLYQLTIQNAHLYQIAKVGKLIPEDTPVPATRQRRGRSANTPRRETSWGRWAAIAASICVTAGLLVTMWPASTPETTVVATLRRVEGQVFVIDSDKNRTPAKTGMELHASQSLLATSAGSIAVLEHADRTRIKIFSDTLVTYRTMKNGSQLYVKRGLLTADVTAQKAGKRMVLVTPQAMVKVLGTRFTLQVSWKSTRLEVEKGAVSFTSIPNDSKTTVQAGHYAVAAKNVQLVAKPLRSRQGLLALYLFKKNKNTLRDTSGADKPLDLDMHNTGNTSWVPGGGLLMKKNAFATSRVPAERIIKGCQATNAITIECWVKPLETNLLNPHIILSLSGKAPRNTFDFSVQQSNTYGIDLRSGATPDQHTHIWSKAAHLDTNLTHLVYTCNASGQVSIFVNGALTARKNIQKNFANWSPNSRLSLTEEVVKTGRPWQGEFHLLAIFNRALQPTEVEQHFRSGPGGSPASPGLRTPDVNE